MHRIRRQILELDLPREAGAYALQQRASRVFQERVLPQLEAVFDKIAPSDRYVRIERLEVDLGRLPESQWERHFVEACVHQIVQSIEESLFATSDVEDAPAETLRPEERAILVFQYFLENGILPWYAKGMTVKTLEELLTPLFVRRERSEQAYLRPLFRQQPAALKRLVWQFSRIFSEMVVESTLGTGAGWLPRIEAALRQKYHISTSPAPRERFYAVLLQSETGNWEKTPPETLVAEQPSFALALASALLEGKALVTAAIIPTHIGKNTGAALASTDDDSNPVPKTEKIPFSKQAAPMRKPPFNDDEPMLIFPRKNDATFAPQNAPKYPNPDIFQGIGVENAGLVLLGPYLPAFFGHLGLVENGVFISEETQIKAVHLLHFLACGQENPEEPALALPKILCGVDLEAAIPMELTIPPSEKDEATALLEAVVRNWPALKNTGPDGLRGAFLQRTGQVSWQEARQCWLLQVERQSQDLLLDRLPWTISVVKLSWMGGMIQVEWQL